MVNKCSAYGCRSGYSSNETSSQEGPSTSSQILPAKEVSLHKFPTEPELLGKWIKAIHRDTDNWKPSSNSRMCSLHFHDHDFIKTSQDSDFLKRNKLQSKQLTKKRLKPDAVPSIFPNCPSYLTMKMPNIRSTNLTSENRLRNENL